MVHRCVNFYGIEFIELHTLISIHFVDWSAVGLSHAKQGSIATYSVSA
jgi:hypothetical protein